MSTLSLFEITQSQLSQTPIIPGQLVFCNDTGNFYRDIENSRIPLSRDIVYVNTLPLAPLSDKIYFVKPNRLYIFDDIESDWVWLNEQFEPIISADSISSFPVIGQENCIYIDKSTNRTYRWGGIGLQYYCIGSDYNEIEKIIGGDSKP